MNLYLVLAIALGAVTGVVDAPVVRPALVIRGVERAQRQTRQIADRRSRIAVQRFFYLRSAIRELRSLRGNSSPRAPAFA